MDWIIYFVIFLIISIVFYVILTFINMKKRQKQFVSLQEELSINMKVVISGGIHGKIIGMNQSTLDVEIARNTIVKVERYAVMKLK